MCDYIEPALLTCGDNDPVLRNRITLTRAICPSIYGNKVNRRILRTYLKPVGDTLCNEVASVNERSVRKGLRIDDF